MKRGFLNSKKAQRGVFQGVEPKPGGEFFTFMTLFISCIITIPVLHPEILVKVPHKTVENTSSLPLSFFFVLIARLM